MGIIVPYSGYPTFLGWILFHYGVIPLRVLALFLAAVIWFLVVMLIKAKLDFSYRRFDEHDHLEITLHAFHGLWKFKSVIPTLQLEWEKGPELEVGHQAQSAAGNVRKGQRHIRFRFWRSGFFYRLWPRLPGLLSRLQHMKTKFYRSIHCTELDWRFEIGSSDAAQTALAAGALWAFTGFSLARLYRQVTMDVSRPVLKVTPQFQKQGFSCDIHCIFHLRIGHIIIAGLNLVRTFQWGRRG